MKCSRKTNVTNNHARNHGNEPDVNCTWKQSIVNRPIYGHPRRDFQGMARYKLWTDVGRHQTSHGQTTHAVRLHLQILSQFNIQSNAMMIAIKNNDGRRGNRQLCATQTQLGNFRFFFFWCRLPVFCIFIQANQHTTPSDNHKTVIELVYRFLKLINLSFRCSVNL